MLRFYKIFTRVSPVFVTIPKPENDKQNDCTTMVQAPKQFITIYYGNHITSTFHAGTNEKMDKHAHINPTTCSHNN